ncbi:MAG: hypothetical protein EU532_06920 [Promethearchaeota archaeon]|nr:MAG: hypothetical protein EU532_06920 [Candidatus Lokiarchaeota archaeon]
MVNKELPDILERLSEIFSEELFNVKMHKKVYFQVLQNKQAKFEELLDLIRTKWVEFKDINQKRVIKKTYTNFLYDNFHEFFIFYLQTFFGFDENSLEMVLKENISDDNLLIEYNYNLEPREIKLYEQFSERIQTNLDGLIFFTLYLYMLVAVIGILIRRTIGEKILITLDCGTIKNQGNRRYLNFLILVRNDNREIFLNYFYMTLYYFLKQFKAVPDKYYESLLEGREKLYQIALDQYSTVKERLANLLYYFYKKCKLLENFCPLLDFLNFVCSRVEDSIFSKQDIIRKEFLDNFEYTIEKKSSLIRIFDFLDRKSTLYSTFQANNLPSQKSQFNLFLLIMKYFFASGLEAFEVGDILFLPAIFRKTLNEYNKKVDNGVIGSNTIRDINEFINFFSIISNIGEINSVFKKIFQKNVSQMNYRFFRAFLKSFNTKFLELIDKENGILSENPKNEPYNFNIIVDHISRMLYVLIDKIFLKSSNPDDSSKNFIDPRGRYIGKNIALRVLELFIFQEFNYSDDIWPELLISLNMDIIKKDLKNTIIIPDKYFYDDKDLTRFYTTYNLQSFDSAPLFEEWIINEIIIPLNEFFLLIRKSVKDLSRKDEIYKKLVSFMLNDIDPKNKKLISDIEFISERLSQFWERKK